MLLHDADEGPFELVMQADDVEVCAVYHDLPNTTEYRTGDLSQQYPEKPQLFKYYGRRDDIVVLSDSERFNATPLEIDTRWSRERRRWEMAGHTRRCWSSRKTSSTKGRGL
ncbi:hypothetical protein GGS23DRAFT_504254 [Durotheca rogersii]|uniref:uncharacterized protein n=1 Tax=Durotheca rogersii TaxID=419775 RepID=UPI00221E430A|nr:uncharacterized protein GGS23DRAFT_504254 [Durotheca rogersii]KAI5853644.1 hypothetical protein GGS23DRAFT_504254 [Durotheca rogersii]